MKYIVKYIKPVVFILLIILAFISCSPEKELVFKNNSIAYSYRVPEQINDGWFPGHKQLQNSKRSENRVMVSAEAASKH